MDSDMECCWKSRLFSINMLKRQLDILHACSCVS